MIPGIFLASASPFAGSTGWFSRTFSTAYPMAATAKRTTARVAATSPHGIAFRVATAAAGRRPLVALPLVTLLPLLPFTGPLLPFAMVRVPSCPVGLSGRSGRGEPGAVYGAFLRPPGRPGNAVVGAL